MTTINSINTNIKNFIITLYCKDLPVNSIITEACCILIKNLKKNNTEFLTCEFIIILKHIQKKEIYIFGILKESNVSKNTQNLKHMPQTYLIKHLIEIENVNMSGHNKNIFLTELKKHLEFDGISIVNCPLDLTRF